MARALILGGTGLIGRAAARRLVTAGWRVDVTGRTRHHLPADLAATDVRFTAADRSDAAALSSALGAGAELLVDCIGYTAAQARLLIPLLPQVGSTVFISSKAVYIDDDGRHSNTVGGPRFDGPIRESQPTVLPREDIDYNTTEGYAANKVAAEQVLLDADHPVTVLRPSKVHGEAAKPPREWVFAKRALDRRPHVLLANRGAGVDHPSAATNIAALIETVASQSGRQVLNAADPDAPSALEISRAVAAYFNHRWDEILLESDDAPGLGGTPWDRATPIVLDMTAASALGYRPVGDYARTVRAELGWLAAVASRAETGVGLPPAFDDGSFDRRFDYEAEDRYVARQRDC